MKVPGLLVFGALLASLVVAEEVVTDTSAPVAEVEGFRSIFDGATLQGWHNPYDWGKAEVIDGEIRLTADKKFFFVCDTKVRDFIFEGEVKLPEGKANSGFMFRAHVAKNQVQGYQAEVDGDVDRRWSGGLYDEGRRMWLHPEKHSLEAISSFRKAVGDAFKRSEWNHYRITCRGSKIKIEVNGVVATEFVDDLDAEGFLAIQHHGEPNQIYAFRNLRVKHLTMEEK